jgi:SSS family solute:Na+ symporter
MLIWFVALYLLASIGIGLFAATAFITPRISRSPGAACRCRWSPPPYFATWFGAEAVFGVSATFVKEGLRVVVADPFGASCA